jgi:hypothetical protein
VHPSWRELLDGKEDDVTHEIVARILKYLNSGDNRLHLDVNLTFLLKVQNVLKYINSGDKF